MNLLSLDLHRTRARVAVAAVGLLTVMSVAVAPVMATTGGPAAAVVTSATMACLARRIAVRQGPSLATERALGVCEVDRRLGEVGRLREDVNHTAALSAPDRTALLGILDATGTGLAALRTKIGADTTLAAARKDVHAIDTDFRVYELVVRQVHLVRADDLVVHAANGLTSAANEISRAIAAGEKAGKHETVAAAKLAAMQTAISKALAKVSGQAAAVVSLTPAQWNAGKAGPLLKADRAAIVAADHDLRAARRDANAALAALKSLK